MIRGLSACLGALALGACFLSSGPYVAPTPTDAPDLEARVRADGSDVEAVVGLAALDLSRGDGAAARAHLAASSRGSDPAVPLLLAISDELQGDYAAAKAGYDAYRRAHIGVLSRRALERSVSVERETLRAEVRAQLADTVAPDEDAVAVLPFARVDSGPEDDARAAAVAALVTDDLDRAGWRAIDPTRLRMVLAELGVPGERRAELAVGVEIGRILGVGALVQGTVRRVSLDQVVWDVSVMRLAEEPGTLHVDQVVIEGGVFQIGEMERRLSEVVRVILEGSPGGAAPIHTSSTNAILAFGRGLVASDRGEVAAALSAFTEATLLDPSFPEPAAAAARTEIVVNAPSIEALVAEVVRVGQLQRVVDGLRAPGSSYGDAVGRVGGRDRTLGSDALGLDVLTGDVLIDVTFPTPGGS